VTEIIARFENEGTDFIKEMFAGWLAKEGFDRIWN